MAGSVPAILGCNAPPAAGSAPSATPVAPRNAPAPAPGACALTHDQIEGPYYRAGAPERAALAPQGSPGIPLVIEGRVTSADCARGLEGIELDVWQANHAGHYDNDGSMRLPQGAMLLRGKIKTDADGHYRLTTIVPGRYLNGAQYRPSHVHVKLRGAGVRELTTQLYFPDDPYNDVDPFIHKSLVMPTEKKPSEWRSRFDFALKSA